MKALYYPAWGELDLRSVPVPSLAQGEVLLRVSHCGICGSELETFRTASPRRLPPLIMGHEFCGYIEEVHESARYVKGQRVISHAMVHCGECMACQRGDTNLCKHRQVFGMHRPGAFAEYLAVPERALIPWPAVLPGEKAIFAQPLANAINALRQGKTSQKSRVLIIGAGSIGLMCLFAAKHLHQSNIAISDLLPERLEAARLLGADLTVNVFLQNLSCECRRHWNGELAEYVIDAAGTAETKRLSLELVEPGGTVVWVGLHENQIQLNSYALILDQKSVSGSYSGSMDDLRRATQLLATEKLDTSWTTLYPIDQGDVGFYEVLRDDATTIKAILKF